MYDTVGTATARHWVTHRDDRASHTACGQAFGLLGHPPVTMPGALVDCDRCADQLMSYETVTSFEALMRG